MELKLIEMWEERKGGLERFFKAQPRSWLDSLVYEELFGQVQTLVFKLDDDDLEATQVHYFGCYSGDVGIMWQDSYQTYATVISYGSCSGCDTLEHLKAEYRTWDEQGLVAPVPEEAVAELMTLCLHMVQRAKRLS